MEIKRFVFSPIEVNTYILEDESGECAIIDCGCYNENEFGILEKYLKEKKLRPVLLLNTHCHLDHIFGNKLMLERFGLRTLSGEEEEYNRINAVHHAMIFGLSMEEAPAPAAFLSDNQRVAFGHNTLIALHVPGHAPGSFAFYSEKEGCVFTGDALFAGSIGRTDLYKGNIDTLKTAIRSKLFTLPPSTIVYPGHGDQTDIEQEMRNNPFFS
jgi:glyoxylase-like metal-dependent hydrolase (beta-lactamase superfamily II)